jgi:hypothetical protein
VTASGRIRIAPSILAADFAALGDAVHAAERGGADLLEGVRQPQGPPATENL